MNLHLRSIISHESAVPLEINAITEDTLAIIKDIDSYKYPSTSNSEPLFVLCHEEYFSLLIKAIEIDDAENVSHILGLMIGKKIDLAQTFNHGILKYIDDLYGNNKEFSKEKFSEKTLLIVAAQSNAHKSLKLLVEHAQQYMSEVDRKAFFSWTFHYDSEGDLSALDILLNEGILTRKQSEFEDLKKSIALFMRCGIKNNAWPILYYPVFNLDFDLIKLMVEEHNADVNEWYEKSDDISYESALRDVMGSYEGEGFFDYNDEDQEKIKNIIAYLLERGAIIQPIQPIQLGDNYGFLASLHRSGSEELYNIVEPYKGQIDFDEIYPLNTLDPFLKSLNVQRSFLLEIRLLDRPVVPGSYDRYQKLLIMQGNSIDFTFAKTKFNIPETIFHFNELEMHNMTEYVANQQYYSPRSKAFLISQQKVFILNVRRFNLMIPPQSNDVFFNLIMQAGSDDDLDHTLNTLQITPSADWLETNNPFALCKSSQQARQLKEHLEKHDLIEHVRQQPAFKSFQRYCNFFAKPNTTSPTIRSGNRGHYSNKEALVVDALRNSYCSNGILSLKEIYNFMQASKAFYGEVDATTIETSPTNHKVY